MGARSRGRAGGRRPRRAARIWLLVGVACSLTLLASPAGAATRLYTAKYKGDYSWVQDYEGAGANAGAFLRTHETLGWVWTVATEVPDIGNPTSHATLVAQGMVDQTSNNAANDEHCIFHQLPNGGATGFDVGPGFTPGTANASTQIPEIVGKNVSVGRNTVSVAGNNNHCNFFNGNGVLLCSTSSCGGATVCGAVPPLFKKQPGLLDAFAPFVQDAPSGTTPFDIGGGVASDTVACGTGGTESTTLSIASTLTVGSGGPVTHKKPRGHVLTIERQKRFAFSDLLTSMFRAEAACGQTAAGVTALVWGTTVGVGSSAAIATAGIIFAGSGPTCVALLTRIIDDAQIVNDPPASDIFAVARPARATGPPVTLPSCASQPAAVQSFCSTLRADELAYIAAVRNATSIDDALLKTVNRESGAKRAHNSAALALQERTATGLVRRLTSASSTERTAGSKIAALLHTEGVSGRLSAAQARTAIARVTAYLAQHHVRRSQLPARALKARAIDLVAAFVA